MQRVSYINGGYAFKSTKYQEKGIRVIRISDFDENGLKYKNIVRYPYSEELNSYQLEENNILLAMTGGTVGKSYLVERIDEPMYVNQRVATIKILQHIEVKYINATILSDLVQKIIKHSKNSTNDNISMDTICNFLIPLPPLSEQKRIVSKIEELEPFIEEYGKAETELTALNNNFPEQIKKSILQYAIQGKLVEQDPNDEPASVLLEKIKAEKAELVKQGKIKKDKQESYIFKGADNRHYEKIGSEVHDITDEIPFEIPDSWAWCRLGNLCQLNPRNVADDNLNVAFIPMNLISDGFQNKHAYILRKWCEIKKGFTHFANNDVGVAKITPCFENRKSVIFSDLPNGIGAGTTELHIIRPYCNIIPEYILALCKTDYFIINGVKNFTGTAGQQRINSQFVRDLIIPLPPIQEQYRIVQKITKMLEIINQL